MKVSVFCLLLFVVGLGSAAPRFPSSKFPSRPGMVTPILIGTPRTLLGGEPQNDKTAMNQVLPLLAPVLGSTLLDLGTSVGKNVLKNVVCDPYLQLQEYADNEERDAKMMSLVKVMSDILVVQGKLSKVKNHNVEKNLVAEAEFFDSVSDALEGALDIVGDTAKSIICK